MMWKDWVGAMISKEEWEKATRDLIAAGRARAGLPPTFEEAEALSRGELPEEEAERVRERLSYYPDMLAILAHPFPSDAEGVLTEEQLAADLAKIRQQIQRTPEPPVAFPQRGISPRTVALAAGILIAIAIGSVGVWRFNTEPRTVSTRVLFPDGSRGGARGAPEHPPAQLSTDTDYELELAGTRDRPAAARIDLYDVSAELPRLVWTREHVQPGRNGAFPLRLRTDDLEPGLYRLVLEGERNERIAEYTLRLSSH
jgi:hypothetical protein